MSHREFSGVCVAGLFLSGSACADVVYSDGEFVPSTWGFETVVLGTGGTSAAAQVGAGNPGNARRLTNSVNAGGTVYGFSRYGTTQAVGRYDPSVAGAIASVDWSLESLFVSGGDAGGQAVMLGAKQGAIVYAADVGQTGTGAGWVTHGAVGLTEADFQPLNGAAPIDFSASGAPLRFGFIVGNSGAESFTSVAVYDNFSVTLRAVPAPGAAGLAGVAALGLACRRRRGSGR
ncbi:MAG: hypothetical protein ACK4WH_12335 [Phycisphaerales bacterium]